MVYRRKGNLIWNKLVQKLSTAENSVPEEQRPSGLSSRNNFMYGNKHSKRTPVRNMM